MSFGIVLLVLVLDAISEKFLPLRSDGDAGFAKALRGMRWGIDSSALFTGAREEIPTLASVRVHW